MLHRYHSQYLLHRTACAGALLCLALSAQAAAHTSTKRQVSVPPSADLHYTIRAQQSGFSLNGEALLAWRSSADSFSIDTETRSALFGKIIESKSTGAIDGFGLAPVSFVEKRFRKEPTTTTFNRAGKLISFASAAETYPLLGGEQDRNSAIWQLIAVARANAAAFKPNTVWDFFVAGPRDAEPWMFKVIDQEKIHTALGDQRTVHLNRAPPPDSKGQQLDIWLAPDLEWYPVRLRFSDRDGDYIEQTVEKIDKPTQGG